LFTSNQDLYSVDSATGQITKIGATDSANSTCNGQSNVGTIDPDSRNFGVYRNPICYIASNMSRCQSPNGQWLVKYYHGGIVVETVGKPNEPDIFIVQGDVNEPKGIRWSPDSSHFVFYLGADFTLAAAGQTGYKRVGRGEVVTWSPDSSMLLLQESNGISLYSIQNGTRQTLINGQVGSVECPVWRSGP
jgi:hypothetical protein